ncbi:hypothetical protein GUI37_05925 [Helcococcus kunzii]|uniref:hypothetical protein n=1 Tax=Helcococcus kunzii TaxID=40091 RepID=UPI001BAF2675|nr:hypothetical protein [Helcococcus kunzii]QUY65077.1 hypothetical protein GUI37_05925 [Helcococcus kunzii]
MEIIESRMKELNDRIKQLKEDEVVPKQNLEKLKNLQYLEEMKIIAIAQEIDEILGELKELNITKSTFERLNK